MGDTRNIFFSLPTLTTIFFALVAGGSHFLFYLFLRFLCKSGENGGARRCARFDISV